MFYQYDHLSTPVSQPASVLQNQAQYPGEILSWEALTDTFLQSSELPGRSGAHQADDLFPTNRPFGPCRPGRAFTDSIFRCQQNATTTSTSVPFPLVPDVSTTLITRTPPKQHLNLREERAETRCGRIASKVIPTKRKTDLSSPLAKQTTRRLKHSNKTAQSRGEAAKKGLHECELCGKYVTNQKYVGVRRANCRQSMNLVLTSFSRP